MLRAPSGDDSRVFMVTSLSLILMQTRTCYAAVVVLDNKKWRLVGKPISGMVWMTVVCFIHTYKGRLPSHLSLQTSTDHMSLYINEWPSPSIRWHPGWHRFAKNRFYTNHFIWFGGNAAYVWIFLLLSTARCTGHCAHYPLAMRVVAAKEAKEAARQPRCLQTR